MYGLWKNYGTFAWIVAIFCLWDCSLGFKVPNVRRFSRNVYQSLTNKFLSYQYQWLIMTKEN